MSRSRRDRDEKDRKSDRKRSSSRRDEDEDERLLRKAKEFVEKEKRRKDRRSESEERSRKRHRRSDDRDEDRKKSSHKASSSSSKKRHASSDDEDDRRRSKSHRKDDKSRKHHRRKSSDNSDSESVDSHSRDRKKHSRKDKHHREDRKSKHKKEDRRKKDDKKESKKDKKKSTKKAVKPDKSKLLDLGSPPGKPPAKLLDADQDYFAYHKSLWVWLYREEGVAFSDLTSDESRQAFGRFVQQYNTGQLEAAYYDEQGLPPRALDECKTTRHKWSFQTSETERKGLQLLQDGVRKLTEYSDAANPEGVAKKGPPAVAPRGGNGKEEDVDDGRRRAWTAEERMAHRAANKRLKEHVRTAEEEFGGGRADYGRERQLEKKKETAAKIHGSARDREDMGVTISDSALYGDGGHGASFQAALARERKRKTQREETKQARVQELQQKEQDKQKAMLDILGLSGLAPGQKIKIAPRQNDGK